MLVDTSVWIEHLRYGTRRLAGALRRVAVTTHPFVIGELACGHLQRRNEVLGLLAALPQLPVADHAEVLTLVERTRLMGRGIGWIDAHLLCSTLLGRTTLWTLDRRLAVVAQEFRVAFQP